MSPKRAKKPPKPSLLDLSNTPEHPDAAGPERPLCQKCGLDKTTSNPYMRPPYNPDWNGGLLIVGEAAGAEEERDGRFFVGRLGQLLRTELDRANYSPRDVEIRNAVRCRPPNNDTPSVDQIRCCRPFLLWEIQTLNPKVVMGVGVTAAKALTNDGSASLIRTRGRLLSIPVKGDTVDSTSHT